MSSFLNYGTSASFLTCPAFADPFINFLPFELPQATHPVRWHPFFSDPPINSIPFDTEVGRNLFD
jgi:hypothetical protein